MTDVYKDSLKKAETAAEQMVIRLDHQREPYKPKEKPPKEPKPEEIPKKNQLIEVPHRLDLAYQGKIREEDLDVDDPVHILVQKFRNGEVDQADLGVDEKFVIIRHMREVDGMTQDAVAEEMGVTRRTVINYCNKIKKLKAQALADSDIWEIGGDLYDKGMKAMEDSISKGKYKDFAYILTSLISTLQSMGVIFKMPKQSQVSQQIVTEIQSKKGAEGFREFQKLHDKKEINLDNVLNELMGAVREGKLDKKEVDKEN
jgi:predicted DNA-binding protein (UPF0251 family)